MVLTITVTCFVTLKKSTNFAGAQFSVCKIRLITLGKVRSSCDCALEKYKH